MAPSLLETRTMEFGARRSFVKAFCRFRPMQVDKVRVERMPHHKLVPILEQETYDPPSDVLFIKFSETEPVDQYYSEAAFAVFCTQRAKALVGLKVYGLKSDVLNAIQTRLRQYFDEY